MTALDWVSLVNGITIQHVLSAIRCMLICMFNVSLFLCRRSSRGRSAVAAGKCGVDSQQWSNHILRLGTRGPGTVAGRYCTALWGSRVPGVIGGL